MRKQTRPVGSGVKMSKGSPEPVVCRWCEGEGVVPSPTDINELCPVCDGEGVVYIDPPGYTFPDYGDDEDDEYEG